MSENAYRVAVAPHVPDWEVRATLLLALTAAEAIHGECAVLLEAGHRLAPDARACEFDASTEAGHDLAKLFTHLLRRQFGEDSFSVARPHGTGGPAAPAARPERG